MSGAAEIPAWAEVATAALLLIGAAITLIGSLGLVRLKTFYARVHPPTLGTTLGTGCIALASMIYFSASQTRPVLHEILLVLFVLVTTPVTLMLLVRAALFRDELESDAGPAPGDPDRIEPGLR
ncbi:MAG TPA: monovalent cation/H(+) antiporter subunit G [Beijerinckiaceae bacterium]